MNICCDVLYIYLKPCVFVHMDSDVLLVKEVVFTKETPVFSFIARKICDYPDHICGDYVSGVLSVTARFVWYMGILPW